MAYGIFDMDGGDDDPRVGTKKFKTIDDADAHIQRYLSDRADSVYIKELD